MNVEEWFEKHKFKADSFRDLKRLVRIKKERKLKISVIIPTLNEEDNIGKVVSTLMPLKTKHKLIDELIVIDSGSTDRTGEIVKECGAEFCPAEKYLKSAGKARGKGENLWKAQYIATGDIICWVDADIKNIHPRFVYGLIGPLLTNKAIKIVKPFYTRPIKVGQELIPLGGGRVTELTGRPLFNQYFPRLSGFIQPFAGEMAAYREVLEKLPFFIGYGVETGHLIDGYKKFGLRAFAQVDLQKRIHRNQTLASLSKMAFGILQVFAKRADQFGKHILVRDVKEKYRIIEHTQKGYELKPLKLQEKERPPMITIPEYRKKFKRDPEWVYIK